MSCASAKVFTSARTGSKIPAVFRYVAWGLTMSRLRSRGRGEAAQTLSSVWHFPFNLADAVHGDSQHVSPTTR
jgi:hypothetical protein